MPRRPAKADAAAVVFALLVLATVAAFALAQRVKRDPLVLDRVNFTALRTNAISPRGCRAIRVRIRFRVTRSDDATVQIVKPSGHVVTTLAREKFLKRYHFFVFYWNGRNRGGQLAPPGRYKLQVDLLGQDRSLIPPGTIKLRRVRRAPTSSGHGPTACPVARTPS
jgi:ribosomal protein L31E